MRTEGSTLTFRGALRVADDNTDLVGQTPMLRLTRLCTPEMAEVFAKLEFLNPGGSVKDRAALGMILRAEQEGLLAPGAQIFEATAGNTGVGLALIGVNRGYKVTLFVPEGYAEEKCILMRGFGAKVIRTPEKDGMQGAIDTARAAMAEVPGSWGAFQFENQANPDFHEATTAAEIWEQMEGRVDALVAGIGSGGTFSGVARGLKKRNPRLAAIAVETEQMAAIATTKLILSSIDVHIPLVEFFRKQPKGEGAGIDRVPGVAGVLRESSTRCRRPLRSLVRKNRKCPLKPP